MSIDVATPSIPKFTSHADVLDVTAKFVAVQGAYNTLACLRIGKMLIEAQKASGVTYEEIAKALREMGVEPPSHSRASVYKSAYNAWKGTGIEWDGLTKLSIDTLYHAGRLIGRTEGGSGMVVTPPIAYTYARDLPPEDLRTLSKARGIENVGNTDPAPETPSDVVTVKMPRAALEAWDGFAARISGITGGAVSRTKALEFALSIMGDLSDEILDSAWDSAHGDTPDPNEEPFVLVDDEEDEDE